MPLLWSFILMRDSFVIARLLLIHLVSNMLHGPAKSEFLLFFFLSPFLGGTSDQTCTSNCCGFRVSSP
jgi:hypothetical protein